MTTEIDSILTREQKAGIALKADDENYVVAWRTKKKVCISTVKLVGDEWLDVGGNEWPADAVAQAAAAIEQIAADRPAPSLAAAHTDLVKLEDDAPEGKTWAIEIDKKNVLVVYGFVYDGNPSVMIRHYENRRGWSDSGYDIIPLPAAIQIAAYVLKTK